MQGLFFAYFSGFILRVYAVILIVMILDKDAQWITGARRVESPNYDDRPESVEIDLLVVHSISLPPNQYGENYIDALFTNTLDPASHPYFEDISKLKVSAHVLIRRDGELVQYVPFSKRAWHAGVSGFRGRGRCNDFSIGIELEGCDEEPFESVQYERLADLVTVLMIAYPGISSSHVVGHSDIAPGRKTDPGPFFDWHYFRSLLGSFNDN